MSLPYAICEICLHKFPLMHILKYKGKCFKCSNKGCIIL